MIVGFTKSPCKGCKDRHENCHTEDSRTTGKPRGLKTPRE